MTANAKQPLAIHYGPEGTTRIDERMDDFGPFFAVTKTLNEERGIISRTTKSEQNARHMFASLAGLPTDGE